MKTFKKLLCMLVASLILLSGISVISAKSADYSGNWAGKEIAEWISSGVVQTDSKGDFQPNEPIKRIDVAILLNRLFNYQDKSAVKFKDVDDSSPYASDVAKTVAAGNFEGDNGRFRPNNKITRQEAAIVFARAFNLCQPDNKALTQFRDMNKIASWSRDSVSAMAARGYMNGSGGQFAPGSFLTRAEAVKIIDNIVKDLKNKAGTYTGNVDGNLVVNTQNVILENMAIKGDLYLTEGIGSGEVTLNNVKVSGRTIIKGGGENSIVLNNTSISGSMIVIKKNGKVRVVASGSSEIANTVLSSGAKLEEKNLTGNGFGNLEVIRIEPGQLVILDGDFSSLSIETDGVMANLPDGNVGTVKVKEGTTGSKLSVGTAARVGELVADDDIAVTGGSRIERAHINSNGVILDEKPGAMDIAEKITATVGGSGMTSADTAKPAAPPVVPPVAPPAGGGNPGGGNNDEPPATPTIVLTAGDRKIIAGSTTSAAITVNPADAKLSFSSDKPAIASVNATSGAITGVSTGSATITVTASKTGYNGATKTFKVDVIEDTFPPKVTAAIDNKNNITLTFSEPVLYTGYMHVFDTNMYELGNIIVFLDYKGNETEGVKCESTTVVKISSTAGHTGLDDTVAKVIKIQIEGIYDKAPKANRLADTTIILQANDTKVPVIYQAYSAKAGSTTDEDTISFYFSEAMDTYTLTELGNYKVTTPAGAFYTEKTLSDYKDLVSVASTAADKKSITFKIKNGKAAAAAGLGFEVSGLTDLAGNLIAPTQVSPYISEGFYVTSIVAIRKDKIEIEFNRRVGSYDPGTFILRTGVSSTSPAYANFFTYTINEKKLAAEIIPADISLTKDLGLTTDLSNIYLHILDANGTKSIFGESITTESGILAGGPVVVSDKAKPEVKNVTGTYGGIIVEFSEPVTTTAKDIISEILLSNDGMPVMLNPGSLSPVDGDFSTGFTKLLISGLESGKEYRIQLLPKGYTTDNSANKNWLYASDIMTAITK